MPSPDPRSKPNGEYKETPFYGDFRDDLLEILRELNEMDKDKEKKAKGGLIKRVGLRGGGRDASQSDFGAGPGEVSSDAGFDNTGKSQVTEINIGDAPTVFDINKVGDPSQNPKSINVGGGIDYTPSFATSPSFLTFDTLLAMFNAAPYGTPNWTTVSTNLPNPSSTFILG